MICPCGCRRDMEITWPVPHEPAQVWRPHLIERWAPEAKGKKPYRQAKVLRAVTTEPRTARAIAEAMGCPTADTSTALGKLAAAGKVLREGPIRQYTYRKAA